MKAVPIGDVSKEQVELDSKIADLIDTLTEGSDFVLIRIVGGRGAISTTIPCNEDVAEVLLQTLLSLEKQPCPVHGDPLEISKFIRIDEGKYKDN